MPAGQVDHQAEGASTGDIEAVERIAQPAYRAQGRSVGGCDDESPVRGVEPHGQDVVKPVAAVQDHVVELVTQHGEDLTCGRFRQHLTGLALFRGGQEGDPTGEGVHDLGDLPGADLRSDVGQVGDGTSHRDPGHGGEIATADIEIHQAGASPLSELRGSHESDGRGAHAALGADDGSDRALATCSDLLPARGLAANRPRPCQNREQTVGDLLEGQGQRQHGPCSGVHRCHNALGGTGPAQQNNGNEGVGAGELLNDGQGDAPLQRLIDQDARCDLRFQKLSELLRRGDGTNLAKPLGLRHRCQYLLTGLLMIGH